jgi:hypothetical protein
VFEHTAGAGHIVEYFMDSRWLQHLRHHERVTGADRALPESTCEKIATRAVRNEP